MDPGPEGRGGAGGALIDAAAVHRSADGRLTITAYGAAGPREVAGWPDGGESVGVAIALSPDRTRVAVTAGGVVTHVDLATGARREVPLERREAGALPELWLADAGDVQAIWPGEDDRWRIDLGGPWRLAVHGELTADDGWTSHQQTGMSGVTDEHGKPWSFGPEPPPAACSAVRDGDGVEVRVEGSLLWPPTRTRALLVLRHCEVRRPPGREEIEVLPPWLVDGEGTITSLPVPLASAPLGVLADGGLLLPAASPEWRDINDEALHVLARDGTTTPFLLGGRELSPGSVLAVTAPDLTARYDPDDWDSGLWTQAGRWDPERERLTLLLTDPGPWLYADEPAAWVLATVTADGPQLLARGERPAGEALAFAF